MPQTARTISVRNAAVLKGRLSGREEDMASIKEEVARRRTFAIISHPDAGKTTLTEKFLLYGGAINLAGSVKGKATARHAVSDWMAADKNPVK